MLYIQLCNYMIYGGMCAFLFFVSFWNFSKNHLATLKTRQATRSRLSSFLSSRGFCEV